MTTLGEEEVNERLNESLWTYSYIAVKSFLLFKDDGLKKYIQANDLNESQASLLMNQKPEDAYKLRRENPVFFIPLNTDRL